MKKKIISLCLVVVLALTAIGGATLAYFTDKDEVNNVFTIGDLDIDLWEKVPENDKEQEGHSYKDLMPSESATKEPHISNEGNYEAYVRVAVVMNNVSAINKAIDDVYEAKDYTNEQIQAVYDEVFNGWGMSYTKRNVGGNNDRRLWMKERTTDDVLLFGGQIDMYCNLGTYGMFDVKNKFKASSETDDEGFDYNCDGYYNAATNNEERIYVFYLKLGAGEDYKLFDGLAVPDDFSNHAVDADGNEINQMAMFDDLKIGIYADAIQTVGFDSAEDAFAALEAEHPLGWWNNTTTNP